MNEWKSEIENKDNRGTEIRKLSNKEEGRRILHGSFTIGSQESIWIPPFTYPQEANSLVLLPWERINLDAKTKSFYYQGQFSFINNFYIFFCLNEYYIKSYIVLLQ